MKKSPLKTSLEQEKREALKYALSRVAKYMRKTKIMIPRKEVCDIPDWALGWLAIELDQALMNKLKKFNDAKSKLLSLNRKEGAELFSSLQQTWYKQSLDPYGFECQSGTIKLPNGKTAEVRRSVTVEINNAAEYMSKTSEAMEKLWFETGLYDFSEILSAFAYSEDYERNMLEIVEDNYAEEEEREEEEESVYVYVLSNPSMSCYKIGHSENPTRRIKELARATGVPEPYKVEKMYKFKSAEEACSMEKALHKRLNDYRVNPKREFFKCGLGKIEAAVKATTRKG